MLIDLPEYGALGRRSGHSHLAALVSVTLPNAEELGGVTSRR